MDEGNIYFHQNAETLIGQLIIELRDKENYRNQIRADHYLWSALYKSDTHQPDNQTHYRIC